MSFDSLGSALLSSINSAAGVAENTPSGLDTPLPFGSGSVSYGALGAFANKIDRSAQRQYIETGIVSNIRPRNTEIIMQEPNITILVKKRQFSSLADNYRYDFMDADEKLFIRASKKLFYNKCQAIAAYEQLTKIEKISINSGGIVNDVVLPAIFSATDTLNAFAPGLLGGPTQAALETIRKVKQFSDLNQRTTWIIDQVPTNSDLGAGTGVFELTNVQSLSCTNTIKFMGGSADLSIEDPYKLMVITNDDIDRAISDATNFFTQNSFFKLTDTTLNQTISDLKTKLKTLRFNRGAADVNFITNASSILYKKVRAIIDEEGREINFTFNGGVLGIGSSATLDPSALQGINGLQGQEVDIFQQIIGNIFTLLGSQQTTQSKIVSFNKDTNYVRQRMRLEFGNKTIIQPMDVVHIFISTKTIIDSEVEQGLNINFSGTTMLNQINKTMGMIESSIDSLASAFGGSSGGTYAEVEKNSIVGPDFPMWLWSMMRNDFTRQAAGTHVFAGIIEGANHSYEGGKYSLKVSAKDQANYFNFGQINLKPSVDVFNSSLYDPLTPFNIVFDASSGFIRGELPPLLDENIKLLNSGSVKAKLGRFRGSIIDQDSYQILDAEKMAANLFRKKLNDPDGFVYRWKRGIGSLTLFGEPHASGNFKSETSPALTNSPFAGQDVMNVLSLLITGQPYNFNTFLKASIASGGLSRDSLFNENGSSSYFKGLINDLTKNNQTWGNFIPFKKMIINDSGYKFLLSGEFDITTSNRRVTALLQERAKRFDELTSILPQFANNPQFYNIGANNSVTVNSSTLGSIDVNSLSTLGADIIKLDSQINAQTKSFQDSLKNANIRSTDGTIRIFGDDISFDPTVATTGGLTQDQVTKERKQFRQKINNLTQRRLWKVKANEDLNLFIVDDSYDKNFDIQVFEKSLASAFETFKSTYSKVADSIEGIAQMLGLEIFADSQGHIQVRPPQYNRMPSSVFSKMIRDKNITGVQIFPDYLESLFVNQISGLVDQVEIIEDQIRIRAAALGYANDNSAKNLLRGAVSGVGALSNVNFSFVTDENTGLVGGKDIRALLTQSSPDYMEDNTKQALDILNSAVNVPFNTAVNFDIVQRTNIVNQQSFVGVSSSTDADDTITRIGNRLQQKTQQPAPSKQTLLPHDSLLAGRSQLDVLNLTQEISQFISERQSAIKLLANAIKNLDQGITLNQTPGGTNALFPSLTSLTPDTVPEIIEHMIEDETIDDFGVNSGKRFVIKDSNIISMTITENPPPWTVVEVDGALEGGLVQGPSGLQIGESGNAISAAFSVDYDMWRLYGFRGSHAANVPFLSDPEGQCAPYGVFLLNKARGDIFHGSLTSIGNEYMQAGEVYYIEDRDLLFYAESVTHSFSYGQQYTTSMSLTYGHNPGEYVPTMLDIIGKGLYTNRNQSNLVRHVRHNNANGDTSLTILVNDTSVSGSGLEQLLAGAYGVQNRQNLTNLSLSVAGLLAPTTLGDQVSLELRIYFNTNAGFSSADSSLQSLANGVLSWLKNPSQVNSNGSTIIPDNNAPKGLDFSKVSIVTVDISKSDDLRSSPSSQAWSSARGLASTGSSPFAVSSSPSASSQQAMRFLFTNIIDIWAVFTPPEQGVIQGSTSKNPPTNQSDLDQQAKYIANFNKSIGKIK